ncbi:DUF4350 domain-containing protein [Galbibacter pacificus]|uniref:DUF4350 domain-containing protein n=1 Tax=Galbibacter pacificus TaxID=2996052 RepID=A0ABT6FS36_9FLAO|nr:DUF4350 domain-containing protein [Galbibacter pacificus]MDG3581662.1 DUF4350 domain-containing protein [Galbibacter pacificus]MDG3585864.1 DUF4350 domain-containing protein [Galbibacter pacificus]
MSKTLKIYIGILVLLFSVAIIFEMNRPKPIDWSPTFNEKHTIPYGLKVFYQELPAIFSGDSITNIKVTAFEFFDNYYNWADSTYTINGNYLKIDQSLDIDNTSYDEILSFVAKGNTAFISTETFPQLLKDSLHFKTANKFDFKGDALFTLSNNAFKNDSLKTEKGLSNIYFEELDSANTTVLGYQHFKKDHINFVKIKYKKGTVLLHTQPYLFTNYYLLRKNNYKYVEDLLSYIPEGTVYFDTQNKYGAETISSSSLRYVFSQKSLKWAWLLALLFVTTFMLFNAKRRQRIIKIIKPLSNTTVQFTKTVANLYYETKDHSNIIDKKITYFLEKIRSDYHLDTQVLNDVFIKQLSKKSGTDITKIKQLTNFIVFLKSKDTHTPQNVIDLNKHIEEFYQKK